MIFNTLEKINKFLSQYLILDTFCEEQLRQLDTTTMVVECPLLPMCQLCLQFSKQAITATETIPETADLKISGSPAAWLQLLIDNTFHPELQIEGDTEKLAIIRSLLSHIEIDWEEWLAVQTNDALAHNVMTQLKRQKANLTSVGATLAKMLAEYVQEEKRLVPTQPETDEFLQNVDSIRHDIDRIEARIARLQTKADPL